MKQEHRVLAAKLAGCISEAEHILDACDAEGRDFTSEEKGRFEALQAQAIDIRAQLPAQGRTPRPQPGDTSHLEDEIPAPGASAQRARIPAKFAVGTKLHAFENNARGREEAYAAGKWLQACFFGDVAAQRWCGENGMGDSVLAALSGGVNTAGGALVPEPLMNAIIAYRDEHGSFRRLARVVPMTSDTLYISRRVGGLQAHFVGEGVAADESDATFDNVGLLAKKLAVRTRVSSELAEDSIISIADYLAQEAGLAFAEKEDLCGYTGDGTSEFGGIVGAFVKALDANHTKAKVVAPGSANSVDTLDEVTGDHLLSIMGAVAQYARRGSRWFCSPTALELVFNAIKITGGGNSFENLANMPQPTFLGYPIEVLDGGILPDSPTEDFSGKVALAFGNLGMAATMGDRRGIRMRLSEDAHFAEDQLGFKATERFDIAVHDMGSTTAKAPLVCLVGN